MKIVRKWVEIQTNAEAETVHVSLSSEAFGIAIENCIELEQPPACCEALRRALAAALDDGGVWCWLVGGDQGGAIFLHKTRRGVHMLLGRPYGFSGCSDIHLMSESVRALETTLKDLVAEFKADP